MADVMADSGYTEEDVFDLGIAGAIVFLVVVPLIGACRVPVEALSHFMAGADDYTAEGMPEHWSGALSGKWTVKRDWLRILKSSWEDFSDKCDKLAEAFDRQQGDTEAAPVAAAHDGVEPAAPEAKDQRQDRRLAACEADGLVMPNSYRGRLPDGVGRVADTEGVTRQAFSADVKAALKRRGSANGHRWIVGRE